MQLDATTIIDAKFTLGHDVRWGSSGYPLQKRGRSWWIDGCRGFGAFPIPFKTKREAAAQWERYLDSLREQVREYDERKSHNMAGFAPAESVRG